MIHILASPSAAHQRAHAEAMAAGLAAHGVAAKVTHRTVPGAAETVICWGWRMGQAHREAGADVLVMERGYIGDRFAWTSLGWNGLNGYATAPARDDPARLAEHFPDALKPEDPAGGYVLIAGQVPGDMSLRGQDLNPWYRAKAREYRDAGKLVFFRPHPLASRRGPVPTLADAPALAAPLDKALQGAELVVTYNSNTAVDAVLAGKRVHVEDPGSMAWNVVDRLQWAARLAWRQFTLQEIRSGFAWEVIGRGH